MGPGPSFPLEPGYTSCFWPLALGASFLYIEPTISECFSTAEIVGLR